MDTQRINNLLSFFKRIGSQNNWNVLPFPNCQITSIRNDLTIIANDISKEYTHFSNELFRLKDMLFVNYGCFNPTIFGQIVAILKALEYDINHPQTDIWSMIHNRIIKSSKQLYLDGYDAMNKVFSDNPLVEICDRSTETGKNIHNGTRFMLAGAMSALRNPKAHSNTITISKEECMRRLMFASMLMYRIDEAVIHSGLIE